MGRMSRPRPAPFLSPGWSRCQVEFFFCSCCFPVDERGCVCVCGANEGHLLPHLDVLDGGGAVQGGLNRDRKS